MIGARLHLRALPADRLAPRAGAPFTAWRWLAILVAASTVARGAISTLRATPLLYPDEYIYSALARSAAATGLPQIRGAFTNFHAVLVPYLMAPAWWVHPVGAGFRVVLALGSLWFSLAAIPAYLLARRVGISERGALAVAVLGLLVPDGVYTTTQLTEPYTYPLFLAVVVVAVDALSSPTRLRQILVLVGFALLALERTQFAVFPLAYVGAAFACAGWSVPQLVRRQPLVIFTAAVAVAAALGVGLHRAAGYYSSGLRSPNADELGKWFVAEIFVALVGSGWVLAPAAIAGFARMLRLAPSERAFAWLSLVSVVAFAGEAGFVDSGQSRSHERYVFYVMPLIVVAAVRELERRELGITRRVGAYATAALAIVLPATATFRAAANAQAPTVVGLQALVGGGGRASLVWALALAGCSAAVALRLLGAKAALVAAAGILLAVGVAANVKLLGSGTGAPDAIRSLGAPAGTALLTSTDGNRLQLMDTLFWNPTIERVVVVGGGAAPGGFAAQVASGARAGLVDGSGHPISGPLAVLPDDTAVPARGGAPRTVVRSDLGLLAVGLNSSDHYLAPVSELYIWARARPVRVALRMVSRSGPKRLAVVCGDSVRNVEVGSTPVGLSVTAPARSFRRCRISLVHGAAVGYANRVVSVKVTRLSYIVARSKR